MKTTKRTKKCHLIGRSYKKIVKKYISKFLEDAMFVQTININETATERCHVRILSRVMENSLNFNLKE